VTPETLRPIGARTVRRNEGEGFSGKTMVWVIEPEEIIEENVEGEDPAPIVKCPLTGQFYFLEADGKLTEVDPRTLRELRSELSIKEKSQLLAEIRRLSCLFPETAMALLKGTLGSCRKVGRQAAFTPSQKSS